MEKNLPERGEARRARMLSGDPRRLVLQLGAPGVLAMLASSLSSLMDALLVRGAGAQAAVALSFPLLTLFQAVGFTLGTGGGSAVSRRLGAGEREEALSAASSALFASVAAGAALAGLGFLFMEPLLRLFGAEEGTLSQGAVYARFVLACGPLLCANLVLGSLLRGQGRTWPGFFAYALGGALSAPLCRFLAPRRGLSGAGIALLAREAAALAVLLPAVLAGPLRPSPRRALPARAVWRDIMRSGLPTLLRQALVSVSGVCLSRAAARFGEPALAGMSLAVRAGAVVTSAVIGFGQGFQPVCGFAWGAGDTERVREAYGFCRRACALALLAVGALCFRFAPALLGFTGGSGEAAAFGARALRAQSVAFAAQGAVILSNMLAQSVGKTVRASLIATSRQGYVLLPLLLLLPRLWGETGLLLAQPLADALSLPLCALLSRGILPRREADASRRALPAKTLLPD